MWWWSRRLRTRWARAKLSNPELGGVGALFMIGVPLCAKTVVAWELESEIGLTAR